MRVPCDKSQLSRRTVLISAVAATSLLAIMTSLAEAGAKVSQSSVHYQRTPKDGQDCQHCNEFAAPNACRMVDGDIAPTGWCRLWVKKAA
jgi:hypothetical protein